MVPADGGWHERVSGRRRVRTDFKHGEWASMKDKIKTDLWLFPAKTRDRQRKAHPDNTGRPVAMCCRRTEWRHGGREMKKEITLKEVLKLVSFENDCGNWVVNDVLGDVVGDVMGGVGGSVGGAVGGHISGGVMGVGGDVWGDVHGDVHGNVLGKVVGRVNPRSGRGRAPWKRIVVEGVK